MRQRFVSEQIRISEARADDMFDESVEEDLQNLKTDDESQTMSREGRDQGIYQIWTKEQLLGPRQDDVEEIFWREDIFSLMSKPQQRDRPEGGKTPARKGPSNKRMNHISKKDKMLCHVCVHSIQVVNEQKLPKVEGTDPIHEKVRNLINSYREVFSETVGIHPAKLPPMELHLIENHTWYSPKNRTPARFMSQEKHSALQEQLNELERLGVISRTITAQYWSHVVLLKKPQKNPGDPVKWRLCIDYRTLNLNIKGKEWNIPNIKLLLQRIGQKRAIYFAVLDLTSGYHQVALHPNSRDLAAFITPFGIFVPNRISMGLKCAPAYFQYLLSTNVLVILLYNGCELYIDDIIIYGETEEEFASNLETVFLWLKQKGLTLNPAKAKILLTEVEAVGHVINRYGIRMSEEKISKVMNFPLPKFGKQLKQFLGLANYFRDHVRNHSTLAQPLDKLVGNYKVMKHRIIQWTSETQQAFRTLQEEVGKCPMLYFLEEGGRIILETDASDYGIGAYLYQMLPG
jgi:hypothetical protein